MLISALFFNTGCMNKDSGAADSLASDTTMIDTTTADSLSKMIEEEEMPVAADELFDDFFFNYAANRKVQRERTVFPLPYDNKGKQENILKQDWQMERFFMKQGYYTLIFNNAKEAKLMKDTAVNSVMVERFSVAKNLVRRWYFQRQRGLWHMVGMKLMALSKHPDAGFIRFYQHFATDSAFQQSSVADPVSFTGPDPDDDFANMTGDVLQEQWPMFAPHLPSGTMYNIVYGATPYKQSNVRFFYIRGIANGMQTDLVFTRKGKGWQLKKISV